MIQKRAPGDQGVRGSNPAYSFFLFLDFEEQLENVFFIAESGSVERNADKKDDMPGPASSVEERSLRKIRPRGPRFDPRQGYFFSDARKLINLSRTKV